MPTYLITGATRGIGAAVVDELRDDDLVLVARSDGALAERCAGLRSARGIAVDLSRPERIAATVGAAGGLPDRLDGIVHSAGISVRGTVEEMDTATWTEQLAVNVVAVAELTRLALPALRRARGTVVMVNSGAGRAVKAPGGSAYAASKFALVALADGLRLEEQAHGVRVTSLFPGRTATDMQRELREWEGGAYRAEDYVAPETVAKAIVDILRLSQEATVPDLSIVPR